MTLKKQETVKNKGKVIVKEEKRAVAMLRSFGLSPHESAVYVYLLERGGEVGGSKIAAGTELHRQYVYLALPRLVSLGLVEVIEHGKLSKYKAQAPQMIEKIAKKKVFEAEDLVKELQTFSKVGHEQDFEMYVGAEAVQKYEYDWVHSVKEKEFQYIIGGNAQGFADMMGESLNDYLVNETRKYITTYYIGGSHEKDFYVPYISDRIDLKMRFLDRFPKGVVSHMVIRKDKVLFYSFLRPSLLYVIKSPVVSKNYEDFFMMLWEMAGEE
jgi:sugar-specific transcriptional regulator TrmB